MKNLKYILISIILAGCASSTGNLALEDSKSGIDKQMTAIHTRTDARRKFGSPALVFEKGGLETYEYKRIDGNGRYIWMMPVIGYFMSWLQDTYSYEETNLFIRFQGDNVKDYSIVQSGGTTN